MFFTSESFINSPYNGLSDLFSNTIIRGDIVSSDGHILATTDVDEDGNETRNYPYGDMFAHVVGYSSNGKSGLENQMNFSLLRSNTFFVDYLINDLSGQKNEGDTVITTLDYSIQEAAYQALGDADGAVVVMEPSTGKILAMVSKPDFDPNTVEENWETINSEGSTVLYNRVTQGQYAPGSVFKIFTTLEFYRENPTAFSSYEFDCSGSFSSDGKTIHCASNESHGTEDIISSFANSCNSSYANISLQLNMDDFNDTLKGLLFDTDLPISLESKRSSTNISSDSSTSLIMETAIGQGSTYVSPFHMVLIASAICHDGILMKPYLVQQITNKAGANVQTFSSSEYKTLFSKDEADMLESCMKAVISSGTATLLSDQSYDAYGKTGTAQVSDTDDTENSWFVGYAKQDGYEDIAIAVIVEDKNNAGFSGTNVAKKVFDAYFN